MRLAAIRFPKNTEAIVGVDVNFGEVNDSLKIQNKKKKKYSRENITDHYFERKAKQMQKLAIKFD